MFLKMKILIELNLWSLFLVTKKLAKENLHVCLHIIVNTCNIFC